MWQISFLCYKLIQRFRVTGLFAGQYNTKLHGTITDVINTITLSLCGPINPQLSLQPFLELMSLFLSLKFPLVEPHWPHKT